MGINIDYFKCQNYTEIPDEESKSFNTSYVDCNAIIGYSMNPSVPIVFLVCSAIGLILNMILIIDFIRQRNNNKSRKQSSMKKLFVVLPILDSVTCLYWILSSAIFWRADKFGDHVAFSVFLSLLYLFVFTFEFIFINFILIHFRKISLNPIEGILKPDKNIIMYFIISILFTLGVIALSLIKHIIGRSPMITSFINTEQSSHTGYIFMIPQLTIVSIIIQTIYDLCCREMFVTDQEVRQAYKTNITYVLVFSLLHIPMLVLIGITSGKSILLRRDVNGALLNYSFGCTVLTCAIPMIIGIIRNCKGFTKIKTVKKLQRKFTTRASMVGFNTDYTTPFNEDDSKTEDQFDWLEKHAMEFFMRDILLGVAHCINNSKTFTDIKPNLLEKENEDTLKHNITINDFPLKNRDQEVAHSKYLNVNIIEYAPKIFAFLRNLENINLDQMIESFLPKNNKKGISESQGKSGSFFISTDDNRYMVKTLRSDEFELIRHTFLNKYVQYITHNPNSLLVRIYGMYNIILPQGDEILIIVMRNVIGPFQDNIIAKYDLKGSTLNRKSSFDMEKSDSSTMKDLNFNEFEHGIMISRDHIQAFRKITRNDSTFLCNLELMDYSVFLVKLTLTKEEEIDIFGEEIRKKKDKEFNDLIVLSTLQTGSLLEDNPVPDYDSDENNLKINEETRGNRNTIVGTGKLFNVRHYEQYLYPSLNPGVAYLLSIIDYFQMFNFYKVVESGLKTKFSKNAAGVSCVDPKTYSNRFIKYFETLTDIKKLYKDNNKTDQSNADYQETNEGDGYQINNSRNSEENSNIELQTIVK